MLLSSSLPVLRHRASAMAFRAFSTSAVTYAAEVNRLGVIGAGQMVSQDIPLYAQLMGEI